MKVVSVVVHSQLGLSHTVSIELLIENKHGGAEVLRHVAELLDQLVRLHDKSQSQPKPL